MTREIFTAEARAKEAAAEAMNAPAIGRSAGITGAKAARSTEISVTMIPIARGEVGQPEVAAAVATTDATTMGAAVTMSARIIVMTSDATAATLTRGRDAVAVKMIAAMMTGAHCLRKRAIMCGADLRNAGAERRVRMCAVATS
jgi:hypothetical protein